MFDTGIEKIKKDVATRSARVKELSEELKDAEAYKLALIEARESGSSSKNSDDELSKVRARISDTQERIDANVSLLEKAKQRFYQVLIEQRKSDEAEMAAIYKSITDFRKDRLEELQETIIDCQVLYNLAMGEPYGHDLMQPINHLFRIDRSNEADAQRPDPYMKMAGEVDNITKERYQKSPMAKKDAFEARINSRKELSVIAEADKLLSSALEETANIKKDDSDVTGK